ncbi:MAG: hypothetical protein AABY15_02000 [Nanoarchaeota archaeon]
MSENKEVKGAIRESLEKHFIDNKPSVEKEMKLLNVLLSTFDQNCEYTYDEYCRQRMVFELEACDKSLDVDVDFMMKLSHGEKSMIQFRAHQRMSQTDGDFENALKEEYILALTQKCCEVDEKMFYQISKYSSMKLIESKISQETWNSRERYFEGICDFKAKKCAIAIAETNRKRHEEDIRTSIALEDF